MHTKVPAAAAPREQEESVPQKDFDILRQQTECILTVLREVMTQLPPEKAAVAQAALDGLRTGDEAAAQAAKRQRVAPQGAPAADAQDVEVRQQAAAAAASVQAAAAAAAAAAPQGAASQDAMMDACAQAAGLLEVPR